VEELQIDWLSSEDLKEEKVVSAPKGDYKPSRPVVPKFRVSNLLPAHALHKSVRLVTNRLC